MAKLAAATPLFLLLLVIGALVVEGMDKTWRSVVAETEGGSALEADNPTALRYVLSSVGISPFTVR